ncbi:lipoxygenase [Trifolium medium]|uniref:Lipoxygenase n=1 Tax=Trifolium medium TaxID=97028 RepID=A0A392LY86_9FABA|nr:lipoxygenase [Trifolium medium]
MIAFGSRFGKGQKIKGRVVIMHKNVLDINALTSAGLLETTSSAVGNIFDTYTAGFGCSVALRLISATTADGN